MLILHLLPFVYEITFFSALQSSSVSEFGSRQFPSETMIINKILWLQKWNDCHLKSLRLTQGKRMTGVHFMLRQRMASTFTLFASVIIIRNQMSLYLWPSIYSGRKQWLHFCLRRERERLVAYFFFSHLLFMRIMAAIRFGLFCVVPLSSPSVPKDEKTRHTFSKQRSLEVLWWK